MPASDRWGDYYQGAAEIYIQPYGPNTIPEYLGCGEVAGYDQPLGDVASQYCRGEIISSSQGAKGRATFTLSMLLGRKTDAVDRWVGRGCPGQLFLHWYCRGQKGVFAGYERGTMFTDIRATSKAMDNASLRMEDGGAPGLTHRTYAVSAAEVQDYVSLTVTRKTYAGVHPLIDIAFCSTDDCGGACGAPDFLGRVGYVGPSIASSLTSGADVSITQDYGVTWTETAADPFADGESVGAIVCFPINAAGTKRVVVARATTDAGNPAEIAYSEDGGATWTTVNVGALVGEFFPRSMSLFNLKGTMQIWACTDAGANTGRIFYSDDGGLTWTLQLTGATDELNAIHFRDKDNGLCVGETNEIWFTSNGGEDWTAITGPAGQAAVNALSCGVVTRWRWFVGYADGTLFYTEDGGATWTQRTLAKPAGWVSWAAVNAIDIVDESCIWLAVHYTAAAAAPWGAFLRSIDGGYSWEALNSTVACDAGGTGLQSVFALGYNWAFGVGCLAGGTGLILEAAE